MESQTHGAWYALLSPREQATIDHALTYALNYSHAGVPGHSAHLLIAKLATELDKEPFVLKVVQKSERVEEAQDGD